MSIFSLLPRFSKSRPSLKDACKAKLRLEALEDRAMPSCTTISGYVFQDANNNGIMDTGELPIAGSTVELHNDQGTIVANATTDANGFYQFDHDSTVDNTPKTVTKTLDFPTTATDYTLTDQIDQFDPSLGQLQSVEIIHQGSITSEIKVENTSPISTSHIKGTVGGTITLTAPGVNSPLTLSENAGTFSADKFDGTKDYAGTSGISFGAKTADGQNSFTLTGNDITPYIGTGKVTVTEVGEASSNASGGGNLDVSLNSSGQSKVTVIYHYIPSNCLKPGNYTIVQNPEPAGFLDGKESQKGVVLNNPPGTDVIPITVSQDDQNLTDNDFGEVVPAGISGFVYHDANNNGVKDAGEDPIQGVTITLTDSSQQTQTTTTDASGFYSFTNLAPGAYTVAETQPAGFLDGKDTAGSLGGAVTNDQIAQINLPSGGKSTDNDFGELKPASLSGHVYVDSNNDGNMDPGEAPIPGVAVKLTGFDDNGPVALDATTDQYGAYQFANLRPGTYSLLETQPANFKDGKDTIGSLGGTVANDAFSSIAVVSGAAGVNYNFGEIVPEVADLSIVKTANKSTASIGDTLTYTLTVTNNGTFPAKNVVVNDILPTGATLVNATGNGWTIANGPGGIQATRPLMAVGETSTITVSIKVPAVSSTIVNDAKVTSDTPDNNLANNESTVSTPVTVPVRRLDAPFGQMPIISKNQLFMNGGNYMAPALRGQLAFIDAAYRTTLGRGATSGEALTLINHLNSGMTRDAIVSNLWNSSEHAGNEANQLFEQYLHRSADPSELATTAASLKAGASELDVIAGLLSSPDYQAAHQGPDQFVGGLYVDLLGTLPDTSTQQNLIQSLDTQTTAQFANTLVNSQDSLNKIVDDTFRAILRRPATSAEVQTYSSQLASKQITPGGLAQLLLASPEFYQLAYGSEK